MNTDDRAIAPQEIRRDIEQTRARMGETIEALGERLNPSRLTQQVKDNVREATIGRMRTLADNARTRMTESGRGIVDTVRENPIPAAMVVGGLAWLLVGSRRGNADQPALEEVSSTSRVQESAQHVAESTRAAAERVTEGAQAVSQRLADGARRVGTSVTSGAREGSRRVSQAYDENPLILGAFAAAAGLAIGLSIPATEREARLMGAKRDELVDLAKERVQETTERARHAAERVVPEVTSTLKDVAREEGLAG